MSKGDQPLTGFAYTPDTVTFGDAAPAVNAPTGVRTALMYSATPAEVCTVNATSGALTLDGAGECMVTATAEATDNYNDATLDFTVTVEPAGALVLNLGPIATDDAVNIAEHAAGFTISGDTGPIGGAAVTVTVGTAELSATSADSDPATWSVTVPADAAYIAGSSVAVTVDATKAGYTAAVQAARTLTVDLTAPTVAYTAPGTLQVGVALDALAPVTDDTDIASWSATGLPPGLSIDTADGAISGTPTAADETAATATVTVTDTAGNPTDVPITFPMVAKGDQKLTDFSYTPATVMFGDTAPTLTAPTGAVTTVSYAATPPEVCTVNATSGALTLAGMGDCVVTATAEATDNYNDATLDFTVTVQALGTLALNLDAIATDDTVNIGEHEAGFSISGDTGSEGGVSVTVTVGGTELTATSTPTTWSVTVPADAIYLTEPSVTVMVSATKDGFTSPNPVTRELAVDLTAPSASYTPPATLQVGVALTAMMPSTTATDIASYAATDLPPGLNIDAGTGLISGTPDTANPATATATVTVTDTAGNPATVSIVFPAVSKGDQPLTGFAYTPDTVTFGDAAPAVNAPTGVRTALMYSATPPEVCTVNATSGALTLVGMGECVVTATAEATDNYNDATLDFTVTVEPAGALVLNLGPIATDDAVNIAEHAAGFTISGDTGPIGGAAVTVTVGTAELSATSADSDPATWSVTVPADAAYIAGSSVAVTVDATKAGYTAAVQAARTLTVDLTAPTVAYTAPGTLQVGVALDALAPVTDDTDIASWSATGLPPGLSIDTADGAISGTPTAADETAATATVTVTDTAGNPTDVPITFPMVAKGDQKLTDFSYTPATVMFGDTAPTLTAPTGAVTTVSYAATPPEVCTVNATSGALTLAGMGDCVVTATAEATDNYNDATLDFTVTVQALGTLALNLDAIATDDTVNIGEHEAGFSISGDTGSEGGVSVTVTVGGTELTATSTPTTWSVTVPADAIYLTEPSVTVMVSATKDGFTSPNPVTRELAVDLTAPSASYTPPATLQVGVALTAMMPSTTATDIASYTATGLPSGLSIDDTTGDITGTPDTANPATATATVAVTDTAGNPATVSIVFPAVSKGDQPLTGFAYTPDTVTFGDAAPAVNAPTGVRTALMYSATPAEVCTVNATSGALTLDGAGECMVTATAEATDNYNDATLDFTVTVEPAGALVLNLGPIATDDAVNIAEHAAGFTISGDTGPIGGAAVTVTVGTAELSATSADSDPATWSVTVPADAAYIAGSSVAVTVDATKAGYTAAVQAARTLTVDLTAPTVAYTAPGTLQVGVALDALAPVTDDTDIASWSATGLPPGLSIDTADGAISGTPTAADETAATATVTVTDTAGNPTDVPITFPMVAKGDQKLTDFSYTPATVMFGDTAPTLTAPTGAVTTVSYAATPPEVCTVNATSGALTLAGMGDCVVTATAEATDNYNDATLDFTVTVQALGTLALNLDAIATDDTVNIGEHEAGFSISGDTGSEGGVSVTVTVGGTELTATSTPTTWSVTVPADAIYLTEPSVTVMVSATKDGFTSPNPVTRELAVDLTAPSASYTPPATLQVGVALTAMMPSTTATDIASYAATDLPPGLNIDAGTGLISGTPDTANPATATATVTVTDTAGNPATVSIVFPAVSKGDQPLTGFAYTPDTVTFGDAAPAVNAPTGVRTALMYSATPPEVCTVNATSGALTLVGMGECVVTATAEATDNYNDATLDFTVTVEPAGALVLNLGPIATDDAVNIAEHAAGFTISGDTGPIGGAAVTVTVGTAELSATSADSDPATWSVTVPADAAYIAGSSVAVTVDATKAGYTAAVQAARTLTVDLTAPTVAYTPPGHPEGGRGTRPP